MHIGLLAEARLASWQDQGGQQEEEDVWAECSPAWERVLRPLTHQQ